MRYYPETTAITAPTAEWILRERVNSAIAPDLWERATWFLAGDRALYRFLDPVDLRKYTGVCHPSSQLWQLRKKPQIKAITGGALFFRGVDPLDGAGLAWQRAKPLHPRESADGKVIKYETLAGVPLRVTYFPVPLRIWELVAQRYGLAVPDLPPYRCFGPDTRGFWQWVLEHPSIPVVVTEGEKKALALLSAGFAAVSVPGVNCGYRVIRDELGEVVRRELHPDLALLTGDNRTIVIAFDQDEKPKTRQMVDKAIATTARLLAKAGASPVVARWDGRLGKGVDDLAANGVDLAGVIAAAAPLPDVSLQIAREKIARAIHTTPAMVVDLPDLSALPMGMVPETGTIVLASGTGTGKTKLIRRLVDDTDAIALLHRVSLARGLANRLGMDYLQDCDVGSRGRLIGADGGEVRRVALCYDSLHRLSQPAPRSYDLVLDEADQGFRHIVSGKTCKHRRPALLEKLTGLIANARRVILASATLSQREIDAIAAIRQETPWYLRNIYRGNGYPVEFWGSGEGSKATVLARIAGALQSGKRVIVATDQLATSKEIEAIAIGAWGMSEAEVLRFDGATSPGSLQREFAANPDAFLAGSGIRLLVHSPSLTSGVSLERPYFDAVVGIFDGRTISPTDALQALARVRQPVPRYVYARSFGAMDGIGKTRAADYAKRLSYLAECTQHPNCLGPQISLLDGVWADYHAADAAAKNDAMHWFGNQLHALLGDAGHAVSIGAIAPNWQAWQRQWGQARREVRDKHDLEILEADVLDLATAERLERKRELSRSEQLALRRNQLTRFLAIDPNSLELEDVRRDRGERLQRAVGSFEALAYEGLAVASDRAELGRYDGAPIPLHDLPRRALYAWGQNAMAVLDLMERCLAGEWNGDTDWVVAYCQRVREEACNFRLLFGIDPTRISNCQIVGETLKFYGIRTRSTHNRVPGGRQRNYRVDPENLAYLRKLLQRRRSRIESSGYRPAAHPVIKLLLDPACTTPLPNDGGRGENPPLAPPKTPAMGYGNGKKPPPGLD